MIITNPGSPQVQSLFLRAHLKLALKGLSHSRLTKTALLLKASALTGKPYKRGQYQQAIDDLSALIPSSEAPTPTIKTS